MVRLYIVFGNKGSLDEEIIIWTVKQIPNIFHPCIKPRLCCEVFESYF